MTDLPPPESTIEVLRDMVHQLRSQVSKLEKQLKEERARHQRLFSAKMATDRSWARKGKMEI